MKKLRKIIRIPETLILIVVLMVIMMIYLCGCEDINTITTIQSADEQGADEISLTYTADFYDNSGNRWLSVEGKSFSISPNKVRTYSWDSSGSWISSYEMSSIMTIGIDGNEIESCGSTIIFADSRLEKCDIDFEREIRTDEAGNINQNSTISQPTDIRIDDWFRIQYWWMGQKNLNNENSGSKLIIIQSQLGNPICMYRGDEVSWDVPRNLPKTTMIIIDGKALYIHRANFAIVDLGLID